jgi:hypothetical protein
VIALIGCSKKKLSRAAPAAEFYTSPLFVAAREYAQAQGHEWFVLSAQYGLVSPEAVLAPYDLRLSDLSPARRAKWGAQVASKLSPYAEHVLLAGDEYAAPLRGRLQLVEPMSGMGIGARLQWLKEGAITDPAMQIAREVLDWDKQFGGPRDAECIVSGDDFNRWVRLAKRVLQEAKQAVAA